MNFRELRDVSPLGGYEKPQAEVGKEEAQRTPSQCQCGAFGQYLRDDTAAACTEHTPQGHFVGPVCTPGQE